ncbi:MAG: hypothetical protein SV239_10710 [Thermodesulfobacteriota bacterium]|jgi:MFS family permease|nr:hypothetical protein [Thermodesulfobacteriota bacterium]
MLGLVVAMGIALSDSRVPVFDKAGDWQGACFGIGQMLGPPAAGVLADLHHGFGLPLLPAALAIAVGAVFIALDPGFSDASQP